MQQIAASMYVLIGSISYGFLSTVIKLAYQQGYTTADVVGSQMLFGVAGFLICSLFCYKNFLHIKLQTMIKLILSGVITALTGIFYYLSLQYLHASFAVILLFQFTWMGIVLEWITKTGRPEARKILSIILILAGTVITTGLSSLDMLSAINTKGLVFGLLSACTYTLFIYISGHVGTELPALAKSTLTTTGAFILSLIVFPPHFIFNGALLGGLWMYGAFLGLFGMVIPVFLYAKGVPHTGAGLTAIIGSAELPTVIVLSSCILDETVSVTQWLGVLIILSGIVVSVYKKTKRVLP